MVAIVTIVAVEVGRALIRGDQDVEVTIAIEVAERRAASYFGRREPAGRGSATVTSRSWPRALIAQSSSQQAPNNEAWIAFRSRSEAEPLLLQGYTGMAAQKDGVLMSNWYNLTLTRNWLVELYQARGKPAKAAQWKKIPQASSVASSKG